MPSRCMKHTTPALASTVLRGLAVAAILTLVNAPAYPALADPAALDTDFATSQRPPLSSTPILDEVPTSASNTTSAPHFSPQDSTAFKSAFLSAPYHTAEDELATASEATAARFLPTDLALSLALKYRPHFCWDAWENYYCMSARWLDYDMPTIFFNYREGHEIHWVTTRYSALSSNNTVAASGPNIMKTLTETPARVDHLGWGPRAVEWDAFPGTKFPFVELDEARWISPFSALDNEWARPSTPLYYLAFYNDDGNIELTYRYFAYRDDVGFPQFANRYVWDMLGGHWGDWEPNVTVVLSPQQQPLYCYYSAHSADTRTDSRKRYPVDSPYNPRYLVWDDVRKDSEGRPMVLVAARKHAAYFSSQYLAGPSLYTVGSPSPLSTTATFRPMFLNKIEGIGFFGYSEDHVGVMMESWAPLPFGGFVYLGRDWVPTNLVNMPTEPWYNYSGKWGESEDSPSTPRPQQHRIRDFVAFYEFLNALPLCKKCGTRSLNDFYAATGPTYSSDVMLDGSTTFHNIYYSILKPLGFTKTAEVYRDIRFRWWNDVQISRLTVEMARDTCGAMATAVLINKTSHDILDFGLRWSGDALSEISQERVRLARGTWPRGGERTVSIQLDPQLLASGNRTITVQVLGTIALGKATETGPDRSLELEVASSAAVVGSCQVASGVLDVRALRNPVGDAARVELVLRSDEFVTAWIADASGRLVKHLLAGGLARGTHEVEWGREADSGEAVPPGVYFFCAEVGGARKSCRLVVLR